MMTAVAGDTGTPRSHRMNHVSTALMTQPSKGKPIDNDSRTGWRR